MRYRDMHKLAHRGNHQVAPKPWRCVPMLTGDYDLDATIGHMPNKDMQVKLEMYTACSGGGYGPRTAYDRYGVGDD
jgi:hypothetical protein